MRSNKFKMYQIEEHFDFKDKKFYVNNGQSFAIGDSIRLKNGSTKATIIGINRWSIRNKTPVKNEELSIFTDYKEFYLQTISRNPARYKYEFNLFNLNDYRKDLEARKKYEKVIRDYEIAYVYTSTDFPFDTPLIDYTSTQVYLTDLRNICLWDGWPTERVISKAEKLKSKKLQTQTEGTEKMASCKEKESALYKVIGKDEYGSFLVTDSNGNYVLEMKGTNDVRAFKKDELEKVVPYSIRVGTVGEAFQGDYYCLCAPDQFEVGDIIIGPNEPHAREARTDGFEKLFRVLEINCKVENVLWSLEGKEVTVLKGQTFKVK